MAESGLPYLDWKGWEPESFGVLAEEESRYFEREIGPWIPPQSAVLEIGFGNGSLLAFLRKAGHAVTGIESNPELMRRAAHAGFSTAESLDSLDKESFDLVVALDVFEHVPNELSVGFLQAIASALRPGGRAVLRFPNGDSPFGRVNQHGDPTHVNTLAA